MACPSCSFARTFARRTAGLQAPSRRTLATSTTAPAQGESQTATPPSPSVAPANPQPASAELLHVNKARRGNIKDPNKRPPPPSHKDITQRLGVRFSRQVPGAQEWATSTYSYNKATVKTMPTAAHKTNELLAHYSTLKRLGEDALSSRTAIATRRKSSDKWYISKAGIKDFGDKIRIDAYAYKEDLKKQLAEKAARNAATRAAPRGPGAPNRAPGARPPFRGGPAGGRPAGGRPVGARPPFRGGPAGGRPAGPRPAGGRAPGRSPPGPQ